MPRRQRPAGAGSSNFLRAHRDPEPFYRPAQIGPRGRSAPRLDRDGVGPAQAGNLIEAG